MLVEAGANRRIPAAYRACVHLTPCSKQATSSRSSRSPSSSPADTTAMLRSRSSSPAEGAQTAQPCTGTSLVTSFTGALPRDLPMTFGRCNWRIHGLPRLRTAPVRLGYRSRPSPETEINPYPHRFPEC